MELLSGRDRENLRMAARCVRIAFRWESTPEGVEYWDTVYRRLSKMADGPKRGPEDDMPPADMDPYCVSTGCASHWATGEYWDRTCADAMHMPEWRAEIIRCTEDGEYLDDIMDIALPWEVK